MQPVILTASEAFHFYFSGRVFNEGHSYFVPVEHVNLGVNGIGRRRVDGPDGVNLGFGTSLTSVEHSIGSQDQERLTSSHILEDVLPTSDLLGVLFLDAPCLILEFELVDNLRGILDSEHGIGTERYVALGTFRFENLGFLLTRSSSLGDAYFPDLFKAIGDLEDLISVLVLFV
jgi:hypothetical protein